MFQPRLFRRRNTESMVSGSCRTNDTNRHCSIELFKLRKRPESAMRSWAIEFGADPELRNVFDHIFYAKLTTLAAKLLQGERGDHTWEAADLVHETFVRIARSRRPIQVHDKGAAIGLAIVIMRHILTDKSRSVAIFNRLRQVSLDPETSACDGCLPEAVVLRQALERLRIDDMRAYHVVILHAKYGLALEEVATKLSVSSRTVKRDWKAVREWLRGELGNHRDRTKQPHPARATKVNERVIGHSLC